MDDQVVVDCGLQTAFMTEVEHHESHYTLLFADLPSESEWFAWHPDPIPFDPPPLTV